MDCPYQKCDGSGLIPFIKNGKIIPNAWRHCDCHPIYGLNPEPEYYRERQPDDYDFPMSSTFRTWTYEHCEASDPGYVPQQLEQSKDKILELHENRIPDYERRWAKFVEKPVPGAKRVGKHPSKMGIEL